MDLKEEKGTEYIIAWKSKVLFKFLTDKTFVPNIKYFQNKIEIHFNSNTLVTEKKITWLKPEMSTLSC